MKKSLEKGAGLLEMMLALVIIMVLGVMSMRYYAQYQKTKDVSLFQSSVGQLMNGLNNYYYIHCKIADFTNNKNLIPELQNENLINKDKPGKPQWKIFSAYIQETSGSSDNDKKFYVLQVVANLDDTSLADFIRGAMNGDSNGTGTKTVTWTRLPLNTRDEFSSHQWIMNQGPGQNFMPGRFTTAVNANMDSKFWILNSNLQVFTKDKEKENGSYSCPN